MHDNFPAIINKADFDLEVATDTKGFKLGFKDVQLSVHQGLIKRMASSACKYILCFSCGHIHEITLEQETKKNRKKRKTCAQNKHIRPASVTTIARDTS
jgi:hypothetical protein